jgi:hypothetical protein
LCVYDFDHNDPSTDDDALSPEASAFEKEFHEVLTAHADTFTNGEIPEPGSIGHPRVPQPRFSLMDLLAERGEDVIAVLIKFTWREFQDLFEMAQDSLHQVTARR